MKRERGVGRLLEHCFTAVIRYLDSDEIVWTDDILDDPGGQVGRRSDKDMVGVTLGRVMREGLPYLDSHLKLAFMAFNAGRSSDSQRISDHSLRALMSPVPHPESDAHILSNVDEEDAWDETTSDPGSSIFVHHLALTLHPAPHAFLRSITQYPTVALTSLDLSYSSLPKNIERMINVLPNGLRGLSLAGARITTEEKEWTRALTLIGRKLTVLKVRPRTNLS